MQRRHILALTVIAGAFLSHHISPVHAQGRRGAKKPADDIPARAAALVSADKKAALAAAIALGENKEAAALDALLNGLALGLHPDIAVASLDAIAAHADVRCIDTLAFFVNYRDPRVRAAAMRAIGALSDRRTVRYVMTALSDSDKQVRAIAIGIVSARKLMAGIEPMLDLLKKGEQATVPALASMANPDLAKALGEFIGDAPAPLLAKTLGTILLRADFGPEAARVQVVRTLAKVSGKEAIDALRGYANSLPKTSPRQSRREALAIIKDRLSGGKAKPAPPKKKGGQ